MTREDYGTTPTTPYEVVTLSALYANHPSYSQTIVADASFTINTLPSSPIDHTMYLLEVHATATITVTAPGGILLTVGIPSSLVVFSGTSAFFGFRYSATAGSWFLLSTTNQA
jgi:hypothetical protein